MYCQFIYLMEYFLVKKGGDPISGFCPNKSEFENIGDYE